ncbi:hypothetical protein BDY21DRAFT_289192 [Lineolata rhizophorae]|uniref:Glutamine-dependent NAD(+) synthetase n=1 Tax=Lineolata rhizophorae TaxID=578093 RepID=A0A6A6NVN9_9PEZI|nr:hypothetical protein BDY21DRAFT_289192 [Lineolata rhizophorae]
MHLFTVATCSLNQWALDFEGNCDRIIESIVKAKTAGASLRVGPELEVTGYGCLDHFLEGDLFLHSWEVLAKVIDHDDCQGIMLDLGAPIMHRNVRYNCRVIAYNRNRILLIRPKLWLANDGNYREMRYFTPWARPRHVEQYYLPRIIQDIVGCIKVPFGDAVISTRDTCLGAETCEELFTPDSPHNHMGLNGVEIFTNSSGSHHELRKLDTRMNLILEATRKGGGVYIYSNQKGCDGDRLYYDGCSMVICNGRILVQGSQFSLDDVEVLTATVDLEDVRSYRFTPSRGLQAVNSPAYERIEVDLSLSQPGSILSQEISPSSPQELRVHAPEEEIALGPACWLWDYLRRSKASGFLIPLSGGIDSCATSVIVFSMCRLAFDAIKNDNQQVISDTRRIAGESPDSTWLPSTPQELCGRLFHTCFMGTENSSAETRGRAKELAAEIGAYHTDMSVDIVVNSLTKLLQLVTGFVPRYKVHGGSDAENIALQNIQARVRMVTAYLFAQMLPTVRKRRGGGGLLVLGSANVDECLRGYLTKYDCSSADINPIGAISKTDLKRFIGWAETNFGLPILRRFLDAIPTAELVPLDPNTKEYVQSDEVEMGMTYDELSIFGRLRKVNKLGPFGMFEHLLHAWKDRCTPREVYEKVRRFYHYYSINRHKMTTITPGYHAEQYSPDDNRYDLRPFLYPVFTWPYKKIEDALRRHEEGAAQKEIKSE